MLRLLGAGSPLRGLPFSFLKSVGIGFAGMKPAIYKYSGSVIPSRAQDQ
jgi:hypothetical protein